MSLNDEVINILSNLKLITIIHKGIICLDYIKNCIEDEDVLITITDFENIGLYLDYNNHIDGVITCENCNKIIKVKNNKQKYCKDCAKEVKSQQDRIADKKYKQKLKSEKIENPENA